MARRQARELAFRTLFQAERGSTPVLEVWQQVNSEFSDAAIADAEPDDVITDELDNEAFEFADQLICIYAEHQKSIDEDLEAALEGWTFTQMAQTDLNVLRLALAEFKITDIPKEVSIEMAIRLAKKYGGEESGRFVNGVLAQVFRQSNEPPKEAIES